MHAIMEREKRRGGYDALLRSLPTSTPRPAKLEDAMCWEREPHESSSEPTQTSTRALDASQLTGPVDRATTSHGISAVGKPWGKTGG